MWTCNLPQCSSMALQFFPHKLLWESVEIKPDQRSPRKKSILTIAAHITAMTTTVISHTPYRQQLTGRAVAAYQPTGHYLAKTFPLPPGNVYGCCRRKTCPTRLHGMISRDPWHCHTLNEISALSTQTQLQAQSTKRPERNSKRQQCTVYRRYSSHTMTPCLLHCKLLHYKLLIAVSIYKKLSYRQGTVWCIMSVEILPTAMQQCRNYLYDKSWTNPSYEVGELRWADV